MKNSKPSTLRTADDGVINQQEGFEILSMLVIR
ncbi:MAG: hypothetical protein ACJASL_003158 [Paraglaciecola sp.]|jgi:hypothetical protein